MALTLDGTNGIVSSGSITTQSATGVIFSDSSNQGAAASPFSLKNRIINGDMVIDQRRAGASVTITTDATYTLDRWGAYMSATSKYSVQQNAGSVTPPAGFTNYLGVTSLSAYSVLSADYFAISQYIEGFNTADLAFGTANARTVTLSFWVRSSLTGTFGGCIRNNAANRAYPFSYTISAANTWEQKSITIPGDTTGTWLTTNFIGIAVWFGLGVGSAYLDTAGAWTSKPSTTSATGATSVVGTNGATFYITGVQLERNTTATPFEWLPISTELALCQRYYAKTYDVGTVPGTATQAGALCGLANGVNAIFTFQHPVNMRGTPIISMYSPNTGTINNIQSGAASVAASSNTPFNGTKNSMCFSTAASAVDVYAHMVASAEL
jgi:hypothetical protein